MTFNMYSYIGGVCIGGGVFWIITSYSWAKQLVMTTGTLGYVVGFAIFLTIGAGFLSLSMGEKK